VFMCRDPTTKISTYLAKPAMCKRLLEWFVQIANGKKRPTSCQTTAQISASTCNSGGQAFGQHGGHTFGQHAGHAFRQPVGQVQHYDLPQNANAGTSALDEIFQDLNTPRSNEETKEEPETWEQLQPMSAFERENVEKLHRLGFSMKKALKTFRDNGLSYSRAYEALFVDLRDLQEARFMDQARLESQTTQQADEERNKKEEELKLHYTDVLENNSFPRSLLLHTNLGVPALLEVVRIEKEPGVIDMSEPEFREAIIKLLVMEAKCVQWYGPSAYPYIYKISCKMKQIKDISVTHVLQELSNLERQLYVMPEKAGQLPPAFLKAFEETPIKELVGKCTTSFLGLEDHGGEVDVVKVSDSNGDKQATKSPQQVIDVS